MGHTITIRLTDELAEWLADVSEQTGVSQGKIIRDQLGLAKAHSSQRFMRLRGIVDGPRNLSQRKGFSKS